MSEKVIKTDKEWKKLLSPLQYRVTRKKHTERAFSGKYHDSIDKGIYKCVACGNELFDSQTKFHSGSGWPSFYNAISAEKISASLDTSFGMTRKEILCSRCDSHLGHLFKDGPEPTGLRYCINSAALDFQGENENLQKATFAAGCFWGVEYAFSQLDGVISAVAGYAGGEVENPTYRQVCSGDTGHAEVVEIIYNPDRISYEKLLETFWKMHDPTTANRQGPDVGSQYRSVVFTHNKNQAAKAEASRQQQQKKLDRSIVTQLQPATAFYKAEDYHQGYLKKRNKKACSSPR